MTKAFIGRQSELAELSAAFAVATAGRPQVILVHGDAGIGKRLGFALTEAANFISLLQIKHSARKK
jgi:hypothetical protein